MGDVARLLGTLASSSDESHDALLGLESNRYAQQVETAESAKSWPPGPRAVLA